MAFQKNQNYQLGFTLIMLSVGVKLAEDTFEVGIALVIISGLMALIGFILLMKGFYESKKTEQ